MKSGPRVVIHYCSMHEKPYPTELSEAEWNHIEPHLPAPKGYGRPRTHDLREILNAVFYVLKSGCQWRLLPTVYHYFRTWRIDGTWERINRALRELLRVRLGRDPQPSAGVVDSQSLKSTGVGGEERLRWWQEDQRAQAPHPGGHRGLGAQSQGPQRQGHGLGRDQDATA